MSFGSCLHVGKCLLMCGHRDARPASQVYEVDLQEPSIGSYLKLSGVHCCPEQMTTCVSV